MSLAKPHMANKLVIRINGTRIFLSTTTFLASLIVIIDLISLRKDFDFAQPDGHPERSRRVFLIF
jgi:hypothetical protein